VAKIAPSFTMPSSLLLSLSLSLSFFLVGSTGCNFSENCDSIDRLDRSRMRTDFSINNGTNFYRDSMCARTLLTREEELYSAIVSINRR